MSLTTNIQRFFVLPAMLVLAVLVSQCTILNRNAVAGDEYGGFDSSGNYQYYPYGTGPNSSPLRPSIGQPGYEQLRQQQEREDTQQNQDRLRSYHEAPAVGSPSPGNTYEPTYLPGGKVLMCAKGFSGASYCY